MSKKDESASEERTAQESTPGSLDLDFEDMSAAERPEPETDEAPVAAEGPDRGEGRQVETQPADEARESDGPEAEAGESEQPAQRAEEPPETVESLRAKLAERDAALAKKDEEIQGVRQGFVKDLSQLRQQLARQTEHAPTAGQQGSPGQGQQAVTQEQASAAQAAGIPVEFKVDENGNTHASIPQSAIPQLQQALGVGQERPVDPVQHLEASYRQWRMNEVMRDPVNLGPALSRIDEAFNFMNARTMAKQAEMGSQGFRTPDEMVHFLQSTGIVDEVSSAYGDVIPDLHSAVALVEARNTLSDYKLRRFVDDYVARRQQNGASQAGTHPQAGPTGSKPTRELGDRPRSQAERGRASQETPGGRLEEIESKDFLDSLSPEEKKEYRELLRQTTQSELGGAA